MIEVSMLAALLLAGATAEAHYWEQPTSGYEVVYRAKREARPWVKPWDREVEYGYDALQYGLDLTISLSPDSISGTVTMHGVVSDESLDEVLLDLYSTMVVEGTWVNLAPVAFTHLGDELRLQLLSTLSQGEEFEVRVSYRGVPLDGMFFSSHAGQPIVYTLSQTDYSRGWWPCKDVPWDKAPATITVTVPEGMVVASNGVLDSTAVAGGQATYYWTEHWPIAPYLVSVTATDFETFSDWYVYGPSDSMPVQYWVYPEHLAEAQASFVTVPDMLEFFAQRFQPYPFPDEKYGMAVFPRGGGMEHQTCTSIGANQITGDLAYEWLYAHEAAHMWWGDMVTCGTWKDLWLNEGFAVYCDALYAEHAHGYAAFKARMRQFRLSYFLEDADLGRFPMYDPAYLWGATVYEKGAWVLHMLRGVVGDANFWDIFPAWADSFAYDAAVTADLEEVCEAVSGQDLGWFFDQWVYQAGYPEYEYDYAIAEDGGNWEVELHLYQVQANAPVFTMPMQALVLSAAGDRMETVLQTQTDADTFTIACPWQPQKVVLDPEEWILQTMQWTNPYTLGGEVVEGATGQPVEGAIVGWEGPYPPGAGVGTSVPAYDDTTGLDGAFSFTVPGGLYSGSARHPDYVMSQTMVVELLSDTATIAIVLNQPRLSVSPDSLEVAIAQDDSLTTHLVLEHGGSGPLVFSATELSPGQTAHPPRQDRALPTPLFRPGDWQLPGSDPLKVTAQPQDTGWVTVYTDPEDNQEGTVDLGAIQLQKGPSDLFFRVNAYHRWAIPMEITVALWLDTDADPATGFGTVDLGCDRLLLVSDFRWLQWGLYGVLLFWNPAEDDFELVGTASYQHVPANAGSLTVGFPDSILGLGTKLDMAVGGFGSGDLVLDRDAAPDGNWGHFSFSLHDEPWLAYAPRYGVLAAGQCSLEVDFNSTGLAPGTYRVSLCIDNNEPGKGPVLVPVKLTCGTAAPDEVHPDRWALRMVGANPFRSETSFELAVPGPGRLTLRVYDLAGRVVTTLFDGQMAGGRHNVFWRCPEVPPGLYLCRLDSGSFEQTMRLVVVR
jgi:aminopeptidase N